MAKTAVVILNYNGATYLRKFLPSVIEHTASAEVIIADNFSTDESREVLATEFPNVNTILLDKNYGFAGGYNKALALVDSEYYVLLNSDVEVTKDWLNPLIQFLDENKEYASCQPKIKDYNHKARFEYAGASGGFLDSMGYPYCRGRIFDTVEIDSGQYNTPVDIFWATGACMMIRSSVYQELGGLDDDFFAHMEEIDLCWRIQSVGMKSKAIPESTVYHVGGGTLSKNSPFKTFLNFRNGLYLLIKNLPASHLLIKFPFRLVLDWIVALKYLIQGKGKHALAILKAHLAVLWTFGKFIRKRRKVSNLKCPYLLPVTYFLSGKKKFSDL